MQFAFDEANEGTVVRVNVCPWEQSADGVLETMLMRETEKITKERTLAPLYEFDLDALKREAACDALKSNKGMQEMQYDLMHSQLDSL